ncbi:MAG: ABC-F family ATP-binding cassette domain-containing protein [Bryobacterales bacterium]|nr:ABC-F family ATP-binding cassette domain-containing protein [Bryobacterales bacterium]
MSLLLNCQGLAKSFGALNLFENVSITISADDRLGLIGPNGSGKSTLLKIMAGLETSDEGSRVLRKLTKLGYVPQDSTFPENVTVREVLTAAAPQDDELEARVNTMIGVAGFPDPDLAATRLSGGWRKRLSLAEAIIAQPDILLLDEPTNHLDLAGILWLEDLLANARFAVVVVSHDRYFLENVATSMAELSRQYPNGIFRAKGTYSRFLEKRGEFLISQQKLEESLATKLRREVEWLRRGAKARTTKSKARIDQAHRLMDDLDQVSSRNRTSTAAIDFTASYRQTKKLIETESVTYRIGERTVFQDVNLKLSPGTRLGVVGANGSGKTTFLRLLLGEREPTSGSIFRAENVKMVYFDQHREQLDLDKPLKRALAEHGDSVIYNGRALHVAGWAKRFLFRSEQLEVALSRLSGGERARVLIARLMLQPADVLLLDEPTNDLDIPTLEVLEESLLEFPGALVLVTHDRFLLDRVATVVLGIEADGTATLYADYAQWQQAQQERQPTKTAKPAKEPAPVTASPSKKKLSYLEAREWESIESRIASAEATLEEMKELMHAPEVVTDAKRLHEVYEEMLKAQADVDALYERWAELEAKQA